MAAFVGMDPGAIRRVAAQLLSLADRLDTVVTTVQRTVDDAVAAWEGQDGQDFVSAWGGQHRVLLTQSAAALQQMAADAAEQADAQDTASSATGGGPFVGPVVPPGAVPPGGTTPATPPAGGTPQQNADWWRSLTPAQQAAIIAEHPELVGNLDGVPGWARDQANRALLPQYRAELEEQLATATGDERQIIQDKLDGLDKVEQVLALGGRQLLTLDITRPEQLLAAVAQGDIDTADHVAVFTPGLTTTVKDSLGGYDRDMAELRAVMGDELAASGRGDETTATVAWLGYEAPQVNGEVFDLVGSDLDRSVASADLAKRGGDDLASFYNGINAIHSGADNVHLTALGHSYGSTTTGYALQHGTGVDDAVFFGSPGLGTSQLSDLHLAEGHAFNMETSSDPVGDLARFHGDPDMIRGLDRLSTGSSEVDGQELSRSGGHSEYLVNHSTSQHNMAVIATGSDHDRLVQTGEFDPAVVSPLLSTTLLVGEAGLDKVNEGADWVGDRAGDVVDGGKKLYNKVFGD